MNRSKHLVVTRKQWTFTSNTPRGKIGTWTQIGDEAEDADVVVVAEDVVVDVTATATIRLMNPNLLADSDNQHLL